MTEAEVLAWAEKETERRGREEDDGRNTLLGPPEAFSGEYAGAEIQACCPPHLGPGRTGARSQTIRGLLGRACAGWSQPPTSEEFYAAMRAEEPDGRQDDRLRATTRAALQPGPVVTSGRTGEPVRFHYYPDTDSLYVEFKPEPGTETCALADGVNVDLDAIGVVVGLDIDNASNRLDLSTLEKRPLPLARR